MSLNEPVQQKKQQKKRVNFNSSVQVVLIPDRQEYTEHNIIQDIWWNQDDHSYFKADLSISLRVYMEEMGCPNIKAAYKSYLLDLTTSKPLFS